MSKPFQTFQIPGSYEPITPLTGTGTLATRRLQKYVIVRGFFRSRMPHGVCECFLAPQKDQLVEEASFCKADCPTVVTSKQFYNCSELEISEYTMGESISAVDISALSRDVIVVDQTSL